jgi:hypothetical protein
MATTTIHVPDHLLGEIDRAAKSLEMSRNRFVLRACMDALKRHEGDWPEGFFSRPGDPENQRLLAEATMELEREVLSRRRNRGAVAL